MYGDIANKLVLEARRTQQLNDRGIQNRGIQLPEYHEDLVRSVLKEVQQLQRNAEFLRQQQQNAETTENEAIGGRVGKCQYFVTLLCLERNKRCLLAYQKARADLIAASAWDSSGIEHTNTRGPQPQDLSHAEQEYLKGYSELLTELKSGALADVDLTGPLVPPNDVFIDVRVLKDAGEIQTEYGVFNLIKDSQFFVRHSDVERLIQQGYLQRI